MRRSRTHSAKQNQDEVLQNYEVILAPKTVNDQRDHDKRILLKARGIIILIGKANKSAGWMPWH